MMISVLHNSVALENVGVGYGDGGGELVTYCLFSSLTPVGKKSFFFFILVVWA